MTSDSVARDGEGTGGREPRTRLCPRLVKELGRAGLGVSVGGTMECRLLWVGDSRAKLGGMEAL